MIINKHSKAGNTLVCALCAILIISMIGANVLMNCSTRYNATTKQVKGWKEGLYAAEAGGDIAYNEIRKFVRDSGSYAGTQFTGTGWAYSSYANGPWTYTAPSWFGADSNLNTTVAVDKFTTTPAGDGVYRIRSIGNAKVFGLRRTGVSDSLSTSGGNFAANASTRGYGDSLLRKIDFNYDHFIATYGDGDGNSKTLTAVANPQVSRRIELIAVPVMPIDAALKATGTFTGPGAAGVVDSYDSKNGAYKGSNPAPPYLADAHNGNVSVGSSTFNSPGYIYGDVTTNGGHATQSDASGVVDNNVPFYGRSAETSGTPCLSGWDGFNVYADRGQLLWQRALVFVQFVQRRGNQQSLRHGRDLCKCGRDRGHYRQLNRRQRRQCPILHVWQF